MNSTICSVCGRAVSPGEGCVACLSTVTRADILYGCVPESGEMWRIYDDGTWRKVKVWRGPHGGIMHEPEPGETT